VRPPPGRPIPPLIEAAPTSRLLRLRDLLLTLAAWGFTARLFRNALALLWDFLRPPVFQLSTEKPGWDVVLGLVLHHELELEILALWVLGWALFFSLRRRDVNRRARTTPPVSRAELARLTWVSEPTLLAMQGARLVEAEIGEGGRIAALRLAAEAAA